MRAFITPTARRAIRRTQVQSAMRPAAFLHHLVVLAAQAAQVPEGVGAAAIAPDRAPYRGSPGPE